MVALGIGALASPAVRTVLPLWQPGASVSSTPSSASPVSGAAAPGPDSVPAAASGPPWIADGGPGSSPASAGTASTGPTGTAAQAAPVVIGSSTRAAPAPRCNPAGAGSSSSASSQAGVTQSQAGTPAGAQAFLTSPITWRNPSLVERVPVLMYHRVVPLSRKGDSLPSLVVPPQLFGAQMAALHAVGWHTITFRQLGADLAAGVSEPPRTLVITFDDGYSDGYDYVLPVFRRYDFVGTFFVITDRIGIGAFFTAPELCALARAGDEIANHTVHHVGLGIVPPATARAEIVNAARAIQRWTGVAPVTLAYPYGNWSAQDMPILAQAGYELAATTVYGAYESYGGRFTVPRIRVGPGTSPASLLAALSPYGG